MASVHPQLSWRWTEATENSVNQKQQIRWQKSVLERESNSHVDSVTPFRSMILLSYFFVKKIPLSRRVRYVMGGWISERCMYVTPIRLDVLLNTNQISWCEGKWYVRFDPETVENGHIYSFVKEKEVFVCRVYLDIFCGLGWGFWGRVWYH